MIGRAMNNYAHTNFCESHYQNINILIYGNAATSLLIRQDRIMQESMIEPAVCQSVVRNNLSCMLVYYNVLTYLYLMKSSLLSLLQNRSKQINI